MYCRRSFRAPVAEVIGLSRQNELQTFWFAPAPSPAIRTSSGRQPTSSAGGPDGSEIPPTGKPFEVDFYTVANWDDGQIVEENLVYDLVTFLKQIGLSGDRHEVYFLECGDDG